MLDDFAKEIMRNLINEMQAVDSEGNIDHKTRMAALKEARSFLIQIIPRLCEEDKKSFSHNMTVELNSKLSHILSEEKRLKDLPTEIKNHTQKDDVGLFDKEPTPLSDKPIPNGTN